MLIQELLDADVDGSGISLAGVATISDARASRSGASGGAARSEESGDHKRLGHLDRPDRLDQLAEASRIAETGLLLDALEAARWNRRQAAASLQIDYKAFLYKLQKYGIVESKVKRRELSA